MAAGYRHHISVLEHGHLNQLHLGSPKVDISQEYFKKVQRMFNEFLHDVVISTLYYARIRVALPYIQLPAITHQFKEK